jgi:hypothetical protein
MKEIVVRFVIGYSVGWCIAGYLYGLKKVEIAPEVLEILEDETSLQYANYLKKANREKKG